MPLFRNRMPRAPELPTDDALTEHAEVLKALEEVKAELASTSTQRRLQRQLDGLRDEIAQAEIDKSRQDEEFARERREIEHHVGLERERTTLELANAKEEARLDARQENLKGKEDLFEEHIKFYKEQVDKHIGDVRTLLEQVMTRIPTVNVDRRIRENVTDTTTRELGSGDGEA